MKMKYEPVKINIKGNRKYGDIACLMDRDDFLKKIALIRKRWKISKLIKTRRLRDWELMMQKQKKLSSFMKDVELISKHFDPLGNYFFAIYKAIICGVVSNNDYHTAYLRFVDNDVDVGQPTRFAIYFTADTTKEELLEVFDEFKKSVSSIRKIRPVDRYYFSYGDKKPDTISNIKRDRAWYWKKKQGKTYLQIAKEDKERGGIDPEDYKETVRKAIKQYEKRLQTS